jgi:hypothetical protein
VAANQVCKNRHLRRVDIANAAGLAREDADATVGVDLQTLQ